MLAEGTRTRHGHGGRHEERSCAIVILQETSMTTGSLHGRTGQCVRESSTGHEDGGFDYRARQRVLGRLLWESRSGRGGGTSGTLERLRVSGHDF